MAPSAMECQNTYRKMSPSLPTWFVAEVATVMDCASTILPITPPAELAAHMRIGSSLSWSAVIRCRLKLDPIRSEEHTSELQSRFDLVCRLLLEKKNLEKSSFSPV